jgi:hypothetical protein
VIRAYEKLKRRFERQEAVEAAAAPDPAIAVQQQTADALNRLAQAMENRGI